ncbi:MAG: hypothetical protein AB1505_05795 [Candidatus Latescibacterota bacterium]
MRGDPFLLDTGEPRQVDRVAAAVALLLPEATMKRRRDVYQFTLGDPAGVVVVVTPDEVDLRLPSLDWPSPIAGVPTSRRWKRVSLRSGVPAGEALQTLIESARRQRAGQVRPCRICRQPTPPEHADTIDGRYVCPGCEETHLGIVH